MRCITQGETVYCVINRPGGWLAAEDEAEVRFCGPSGETEIVFATGGRAGAQPIVSHRNGRMSFILSSELTARMVGSYRIELRIVCAGSVVIRRGRVRVIRSEQGNTNI